MFLLTVVIVTSPVPSNPDTSVLRAVFAAYSRVEGLQRTRKIIHFDGPQPRLPPERKSAYEEFKRRVLVLAGEHPDFAHLQCYSADRFLFAAHNLAAAVAQARPRTAWLPRPLSLTPTVTTAHTRAVSESVVGGADIQLCGVVAVLCVCCACAVRCALRRQPSRPGSC